MRQLNRKSEKKRYDLCWFCQHRLPDPHSSVKWDMHKVVSPDWSPYVKWQSETVHVPRCRRCKLAHGGLPYIACIVGGVTWISVWVLFLEDQGLGYTVFFVGLIIAAIVFGGVVGGFITEWKGTEDSLEAKTHPLVLGRKANGWRDGDRPS